MSNVSVRSDAVVESALQHIQTALSAATQKAIENLTNQAGLTARLMDRDQLLDASGHLKQCSAIFEGEFKETLRGLASKDLQSQKATDAELTAATDWMCLSLVDEESVDDKVASIRIGHQLALASEAEFWELLPFLGTVLEIVRTDEHRNPIRPSNIGRSIQAGISAITQDHDLRKAISRELSRTMSDGLRHAYVAIREELQHQGVKAVAFTIKTAKSSPAQAAQTPISTGIPFARNASGSRQPEPDSTGPGTQQSGSHHNDSAGTAGLQSQTTSDREGLRGEVGAISGNAIPQQQLMTLLSQISRLSSGLTTEAEHSSPQGNRGELPAGPRLSAADLEDEQGPESRAPTNLIRSHRAALMEACGSKLDKTIIDVVAGVFDQILSDPQVAAPIALLIARLQLPVLRVALLDNTFFSSRTHPVRRFVNRIASLSCAFNDFNSGPAEQLLGRMRDLIQEISNNEIDQSEVYDEKVSELDAFVSQLAQSASGPKQGHLAGILTDKESELQVQQRYMLQLQAALKQFNMPAYLRDFLSQIWSQVIVSAGRQWGPDDERTQRTRRTGRDLVLSVQPKGAPEFRKKFIKLLPGMMKNLKAGLAMVGWPEEAQDAFIGVLLASHSTALKQPPMSELDYNMLSHELDVLFNAQIRGLDGPSPQSPPSAKGGTLTSAITAAQTTDEDEVPLKVEHLFTPEEAQDVGLIDESSVDWYGKVDTPLQDDNDAPENKVLQNMSASDTFPIDVKLDNLNLDLNLAVTQAPDPSEGKKLTDSLQLGYAYYMIRKDEWQKVRLNFISPGREFFAFSMIANHGDVISCTARMVNRMFEAGRLRAVESTDLLQRATVRAVEQIASLQPPATGFLDSVAMRL